MRPVLMGTIWFHSLSRFDWVIIRWWPFINCCGPRMRWIATLSSLLVAWEWLGVDIARSIGSLFWIVRPSEGEMPTIGSVECLVGWSRPSWTGRWSMGLSC
jgi:hypothetical protein